MTYAEWGAGDMGMGPWPEDMLQARGRVGDASKEGGIYFLDFVTPEIVVEQLDDGVMLSSCGPWGEEEASIGRAHTGRTTQV